MGDLCSCERGGKGFRMRLVRRAGLALAGVLGMLWFAPAALALTPPRIYWAYGDSGAIYDAHLDGTALGAFVMGTSSNVPIGVAVDGQHIYWANSGKNTLGEANLGGGGVNESLISADGLPQGVAVDRQHIFWANYNTNTIGEANLDGTGVNQSFIVGADGPEGVAVDGQYIYWANNNTGTIGRAKLDGTDADQSFITNANAPFGVAVNGHHIYWANNGANTIGEANLDGTDANQNFITGASGVLGVAVDGEHVYWSDSSTSTLGEANVDGTDVNQNFINVGSNLPTGVAVSVPVAGLSPTTPPAFPTTQQDTLGQPQTLTISNSGQRDLSINGLSFTGADPADFLITSDSCLGSVAPDESCQLAVNFAPQGLGARSATLQIATNDYANSPLAVPLSGTGGAAPDAPGFVSASGGHASATVSWLEPADHGSAITSYTVTPYIGSSPQTPVIVSCPAQCGSSPIQTTLTGLTNGTAYVFYVTATNPIGTSPPSDPSPPTTPQRAASSTALSLSKATVTFGSEQLERFSALVSSRAAGKPTGKVIVHAGAVSLCTIRLVSGKGSCSPHPKALPAGRHTIAAGYSGDTNFTPSAAQAKTLTVKP